MRYLFPIVFLLCLVSGSFAGEPLVSPDKNIRCAVCGMFVAPYADWNATIAFADSAPAVFDGAKDMFKYYLDRKRYDPAWEQKKITKVLVKDYSSKKDTDAFEAWYVIWGDVYGPMGNEPIPFATEPDARRFLKEHHGKKVLHFTDVTLKLLSELDNPE
jgi:copper chaperone NosL